MTSSTIVRKYMILALYLLYKVQALTLHILQRRQLLQALTETNDDFIVAYQTSINFYYWFCATIVTIYWYVVTSHWFVEYTHKCFSLYSNQIYQVTPNVNKRFCLNLQVSSIAHNLLHIYTLRLVHVHYTVSQYLCDTRLCIIKVILPQ